MAVIDGSLFGPGDILRLTWDDVMELCKELALAIHEEFNPDLIVGVAKGGVIPGVIISSLLRKDFVPVSLSRRHRDRVVHSLPQVLVPLSPEVEGHSVLIVDETSATGETFQMAVREAQRKGARRVKTAALYVPRAGYMPNWFALQTDALVMKPWDFEVLENGRFVIRKEYLVQIDRME